MTTKLNYPAHTLASAPENSKPALEQLEKAFGVIPNIAGAIANSPKLINSLVGVFQQVHSSSFTEQEIQIVLLTDAVVNSCTYAVAFHTRRWQRSRESVPRRPAPFASGGRPRTSDLPLCPPWLRRSLRNVGM